MTPERNTRRLTPKIVAFVLTLCLLCGMLPGCSLFPPSRDEDVEDESSFEQLAIMTFNSSPYYTPLRSRYAYGQLGARQQQFYDAALEKLDRVSPVRNNMGTYPMPSFRISGQLSEGEMRVALRALTDDNPYYFWLSRTFSHRSYLDENYMIIYLYSSFSPAALSQMLTKTDDVIGDFYAAVPSGMSDYEREKYVHDYLIDLCDYDEEVAASTEMNEKNLKGHSIYGALVDHRCVCEGYGMTMQLLLNGLGVECVTVTGKSDQYGKFFEALHLWNAVKISDSWYHVDVTWDDQDDPLYRYDYFNLNDATLLQDHTFSPSPAELGEEQIAANGSENMNVYRPLCPSMKENYYVRECAHLTSYSGGEVKDTLYVAAQDRANYFTFYIDPAHFDFDDAVTQLFREYPQYFFDYVAAVNRRLYDYEIDDSNLSYILSEKLSKVTVVLNYY